MGRYRELLTFLLVALAITYPTVWLSAGARGRYYMPLYPCFALLVGIVVRRCTAPGGAAELARGWRRISAGAGVLAGGGALLVAIANLVDLHLPISLALPMHLVMLLVAICVPAALILAAMGRGLLAARPRLALLSLAALFGAGQTILLVSLKAQGSNDLTADVAQLRAHLPAGAGLVSLGPIAHRFAYYYGPPIPELPWPEDAEALPAGVQYFCFEQHRNDTAVLRDNGRGRSWTTTSGRLPFAWEQIAWIPCDPGARVNPVIAVVVGRIATAAKPGDFPSAGQAQPSGEASRLPSAAARPSAIQR